MASLIQTRADLLNYHAEMHGLSVDFLRRQGLIIGAVAAELRRSGYEVVIQGKGEERVLFILSVPAIGAARRAKDQGKLVEIEPVRARTYGYGEDPE